MVSVYVSLKLEFSNLSDLKWVFSPKNREKFYLQR